VGVWGDALAVCRTIPAVRGAAMRIRIRHFDFGTTDAAVRTDVTQVS
jgi:hypothetical protein